MVTADANDPDPAKTDRLTMKGLHSSQEEIRSDLNVLASKFDSMRSEMEQLMAMMRAQMEARRDIPQSSSSRSSDLAQQNDGAAAMPPPPGSPLPAPLPGHGTDLALSPRHAPAHVPIPSVFPSFTAPTFQSFVPSISFPAFPQFQLGAPPSMASSSNTSNSMLPSPTTSASVPSTRHTDTASIVKLPHLGFPKLRDAISLRMHFQACERVMSEVNIGFQSDGAFVIKEPFQHRALALIAESLSDSKETKGIQESFQSFVYRMGLPYATARAQIEEMYCSKQAVAQAVTKRLQSLSFSAQKVDEFTLRAQELNQIVEALGDTMFITGKELRKAILRLLPQSIAQQTLMHLQLLNPVLMSMDAEETLVTSSFASLTQAIRHAAKMSTIAAAATDTADTVCAFLNSSAGAQSGARNSSRGDHRQNSKDGDIRQNGKGTTLSEWAGSHKEVLVANVPVNSRIDELTATFDAKEVKIIKPSRGKGKLALLAFDTPEAAAAAVEKAQQSHRIRRFEIRSGGSSGFPSGDARRGSHRH